ncbi:RNA-dependent RNA polymerase [Hubei leech virus 1]|uniref:RNA-dependent RNA polymerase n=1 Tax=Hubei leech virus 1 TaxID=1922899 RepID=UPI00090BE2F8|nr:RNA-dependent RNA polymerase [Hubei leech virus 1]APG79044.1 RNA-dependent RNA polymerase [Hubei leech virus 1]
MDLGNSPGWPWRRHVRTKQQAIDAFPEVLTYWDAPGPVVWHGFGKLEILPSEKADRKCRLITGAPVDLALLGARLYEDFNDRFTTLHTETHSALGMSKFHRGWATLAAKMDGPVTEADAKQWDSSMTIKLLEAVYRIRWACLRSEDQTAGNWARHQAYLRELTHSTIHLPDGSMWEAIGGNKSGSVNTAHDNTIGHIIVCLYAWLRLGRCSKERFWEYPFALYGDDFLAGKLEERFFDFYRETGIRLPRENVVQHDQLEGASFLSQRFKKVDGQWVAEPDGAKALFSACTSDLKPNLRLAFERVRSLWLDAYWTEAEETLRRACNSLADELGEPRVSRLLAKRIWNCYEIEGGSGVSASPQNGEHNFITAADHCERESVGENLPPPANL